MNVIMEQHRQHPRRRGLLGLILILVGLALVGNQLNVIPGDLRDILFTWQSLLILIGIIFLGRRENKATGFILIFIGGFFLLPEIFDISYEWRRLFWPITLIIIGVAFIFGATFWHRNRFEVEGTDDDFLDDVNVFGGHDRIVTSSSFRGGSIISVFGGGKYDLRNANLSTGTNVLEMTNVFGGGKLIVPSDWDVKVEVVAIFGGYSDKRVISAVSPGKRLIIKGISLFGGGEITSI